MVIRKYHRGKGLSRGLQVCNHLELLMIVCILEAVVIGACEESLFYCAEYDTKTEHTYLKLFLSV